MNNIKFKSAEISEKEFVNKLRKNVSDYFTAHNISTKANAAMVVKTIFMLSLYVVPFIVLLVLPMSPLMGLGISILMGIGIAGVGMGVMHDACHSAYSTKGWVNDLLGGSLYLLGSNVLNWKIQHNLLHHTYTNISGIDEDIATKGPIRLAMKAAIEKHHQFQYVYAIIFYGLMTIVKLINDFPNLFKYNRKGLLRGKQSELKMEFVKMVVRKVIYVAIVLGLPIWLTPFTWYHVLIGFLVMHWVAGMILSVVFQLAHVVEGAEQPVVENENYRNWHIHQLKTTSDFARNNKLLGWYVGGLNFQIEHHLFPNICHIHYDKIAPIVEQTAIEFGLPYNLKPTFASALISHIKMLKVLGVE